MDAYDQFVGQFNPTGFDAGAWVRQAKRAGMKYMVITTKRHDGHCLWPSELTEYDIASTPFDRDILGELRVPASGLPGVDLESCTTMNKHWCRSIDTTADWRQAAASSQSQRFESVRATDTSGGQARPVIDRITMPFDD